MAMGDSASVKSHGDYFLRTTDTRPYHDVKNVPLVPVDEEEEEDNIDIYFDDPTLDDDRIVFADREVRFKTRFKDESIVDLGVRTRISLSLLLLPLFLYVY